MNIATREILLGFWKVHILHHASEEPIHGQWVLTELRRHGYEISPGTLYPLLHRLRRKRWVNARLTKVGGRERRYYCITPAGRRALAGLRRDWQHLLDCLEAILRP